MNLKTQIVMKPKNSNCDETQKNEYLMKLKNQIVRKRKNSNCDKTQKLKFDKIKIVTKLKF